MGGSSKSSSSSSTSSYQYDNRIAATDNAVVARADGTNSYVSVVQTDHGAIAGASQIANKSLDNNLLVTEKALEENGKIALAAVNLGGELSTGALDAIHSNSETAFQFVDKQRQDSDLRAFQSVAPWLISGASLVAITFAMNWSK